MPKTTSNTAKNVFPENFVETFVENGGTMTKKQWAHLHELSYMELYVLDLILGGKVAQFLNTNGHPNTTVCPECHVDDFFHVEGCSHQIE